MVLFRCPAGIVPVYQKYGRFFGIPHRGIRCGHGGAAGGAPGTIKKPRLHTESRASTFQEPFSLLRYTVPYRNSFDQFRRCGGNDRGQGDPGTKKKGRPQSVAVPLPSHFFCAKDLFRHRHAGKVSGDVAHQGRRSPSATFFGDTRPQGRENEKDGAPTPSLRCPGWKRIQSPGSDTACRAGFRPSGEFNMILQIATASPTHWGTNGKDGQCTQAALSSRSYFLGL